MDAAMRPIGPAPFGLRPNARHAALLLPYLESPNRVGRALPGEHWTRNAATSAVFAGPNMNHAFKIGDTIQNAELSRAPFGYRLHLDGGQFNINLQTSADGRTWLTVDDRHVEVVIAQHGDEIFVHLDGQTYQLNYQHPLDRLAAAAAAGGAAEDQILAPMPGSIVSLAVETGDLVVRGQTLLVMESMKMETTISADRDGVVAAVSFDVGQSFDRDALLISLEPQEKTS